MSRDPPEFETQGFETQDSAGYLANHMARLFAKALAERIKPLGLTPGQFPALLALWRQDGRTQGELARELAIEQATMANTLARMERDGIVARTVDPADGRAQRVWLTAAGRALKAPAIAAAQAVNAAALAGLDPAAQAAFKAAMRQVIAALSARAP